MNKNKVIKYTILVIFLVLVIISGLTYIPMIKFDKNYIYSTYDIKNSYEEFDKIYDPSKIQKTKLAKNEDHIIVPLQDNLLHPNKLVYTLIYNPFKQTGSYGIDVFTYKKDSIFSQDYNLESIYSVSMKKYPTYNELIQMVQKENLSSRIPSDEISHTKVPTPLELKQQQEEQTRIKKEQNDNIFYYGYSITEAENWFANLRNSNPEEYEKVKQSISTFDIPTAIKWLVDNGYLSKK